MWYFYSTENELLKKKGIYNIGFEHDLSETDQSQYKSWPFNEKLEITICLT